MKRLIYLDHNATTSLDPAVLEVVSQELKNELGNPSSVHFHGRQCKSKLERARDVIAAFLNVKSSEFFFTSGGTEGANLLLRGFLSRSPGGHVITSNAEHSCIYHTLKIAEKNGAPVTFLPAGLQGAVSPEQVLEAITPQTKLITLMAVNNETGVKTDIEAIARIAQERDISFLVDGVALLGKEAFSIYPGVSALFFSGHKLHAPKGVGAVFCRSSFKIDPILTGGNQEFGRRAGTENLPAIIGFAKAVELLSEQSQFTHKMRMLRDRFETDLMSNLEGVLINGIGPRVVNTSNLSFEGVDGESLLMGFDLAGISVSHGSACASGAIEPSRILLNMGIPMQRAQSAIRFSLSRHTTEQEIEEAIATTINLVNKLRKK